MLTVCGNVKASQFVGTRIFLGDSGTRCGVGGVQAAKPKRGSAASVACSFAKMDGIYDALNAQWHAFHAAWPYHEHWFITVFLTAAHAAIWIPFNAFLFVIMYWGPAAAYFDKYKIRKGQLPPWRLVKQALTEMVRIQCDLL